ncbi:MAG: SAV_6107 family HEPN domain-containing protein [Corynebacterium sp.]|nr:SAV_6107 family HEPN domain-containing protein [Corynebacterium sp.]
MATAVTSIVSANDTASLLPAGSKAARLCRYAHFLLAQAEEFDLNGDPNTAFEYFYRAALRVGAARVALSPIGARKRKPKGVWEQLKMVDRTCVDWAKAFEALALTRRRAATFASYTVSEEALVQIRDLVERFLVDTEFDGVPDPVDPGMGGGKAA